jgi:hypothetical protein
MTSKNSVSYSQENTTGYLRLSKQFRTDPLSELQDIQGNVDIVRDQV